MIQDKPKELDQTDIDRLKQKHSLALVTIELKDGTDENYFIRSLTRKETYAIAEISKEEGIEKGNHLFVNSAVLAGNMELIKEDDGALEVIIEHVQELQEAQKKVSSSSATPL